MGAVCRARARCRARSGEVAARDPEGVHGAVADGIGENLAGA